MFGKRLWVTGKQLKYRNTGKQGLLGQRGDGSMADHTEETMLFRVKSDKSTAVKHVLRRVYLALEEKGYDPVNQIVGYLISGDPTYITSHNNARSLIRTIERDELMEELVESYLNAI